MEPDKPATEPEEPEHQLGWWDSTWYDPRRAPGGQSRVQGRLRDGFAALRAGDDEDLSDCEQVKGQR